MVYVDDFYKTGIKYRGMKMSHMMADTRAELLFMVKRIGVSQKHIQDKGTKKEHFDVCLAKRERAIQLGAIPVPFRKLPEVWQGRDMKKYLNK